MLKNYLKIALRNIIRHKGYSFINIAGLAVGMACCFLIILWVQDELSYDKFHENAESICRVVGEEQYSDGSTDKFAVTPKALALALKEEYPEVINSTVISDRRGSGLFKYGEKAFYERKIVYADEFFFSIFRFPFIKGDLKTALSNPYSVVITEGVANKYFGNEDPIGKTLIYNNTYNLSVTGVLKNIPNNSHLQFDFFVPIKIQEDIYTSSGLIFQEWGSYGFYTFLQLQENIQSETLDKKITRYLDKRFEDNNIALSLQPLTKIHLYSDLTADIGGRGDIKYVYIFSIIAFFVLIIACINFMNLATARSSMRAKEIGIRKVAGAYRSNLIKQFLGESIFISFIALVFAIVLVELFLPTFNNLSGKALTLSITGNIHIILALILITIITGLLSGSYPAFFLSSFKPITTLKGSTKRAGKSISLRKILILFQFAITIILLVGTISVYKQLDYVRNRKLGYEKEHIVHMPLRGELSQKYESMKNYLLKNVDVLNVSIASALPTGSTLSTSGSLDWEGKSPDDEILMNVVSVDHDYIDTFKMEIIQGRDFSKKFTTDASAGFILNEAAIKAMGIESPIGKRFSIWETRGNIIGVVKNYHFDSLHKEIEPLVLAILPDLYSHICVKIKSDSIPNTISELKTIWNKYFPGYPFEYHFLDESLDNLYRIEERIGTVFKYFTVIAIIISCLGLFGLASFTTEQRTKEIGIRKVLGATIPNILFLLTKDFTKWVLMANIIAWPVAYYAMNRWLQYFAYRTNIGLFTFILSAVLTIIIAFITVSYQSIKAALANPIEALRYE
jgi:ABC-type antimicrobial peptide transport system permease subunit